MTFCVLLGTSGSLISMISLIFRAPLGIGADVDVDADVDVGVSADTGVNIGIGADADFGISVGGLSGSVVIFPLF